MKFWARNDKYNWICNYSANKGGKGLNNTGKGATVLLIYLLTFGVNTNACKRPGDRSQLHRWKLLIQGGGNTHKKKGVDRTPF